MIETAARPLTSEELRAYDSDGVVCLRGILDEKWIGELRRALDEVLASPGPQGKNYPDMGSGRFGYDTFMWTRHPGFPGWSQKCWDGSVRAMPRPPEKQAGRGARARKRAVPRPSRTLSITT